MDWISTHLPILVATFPFIVFVAVLLWGNTSLAKTSALTLGIFVALAIVYWKIYPIQLWFSFGKGFFVALDIFIIILGAIFFLDLLEKIGVIENISYYLEHFSRDYRLQIILLAWLFEAFIEGTAGFGTPVAIVAPLLVGLGLSPLRALIVALMGNSAAVVFGAVGTPIRVGFAGLDISAVPLAAALINCIGFIVPIFMLWVITKDRVHRRKEFFDALPFAIWAGIAFVAPSVFCVFLGQEFPSIVGSIIGMVLVYATTKLGIFVPKEHLSLKEDKKLVSTMSAGRAFFPYILLIVLLILGKFILGSSGLKISLGFSHTFNWFNPGFAFILAGIIVAAIWKSKKREIASLSSMAIKGALGPFAVILSMSILVQIMTNSGQNSSGLPAAISLVAKVYESAFLPFFSPFIGAFGSFVTGSATVSNIMFGNFFDTAAKYLGMSPTLILSLAVVGASAGNMIALSDMLAGQAVLKLKNQERQVLKGVLVPCLIFLLITGAVGLLLS